MGSCTDMFAIFMDIRSLQVDDEIRGVFYNNKIVEEYSKIYINDIKNYKEYTIEDFEMRTGNDKLKEKFFLLFAPLM